MTIKVKVYAPGFINHEIIDQNGFVELAEDDSVRVLFKKLKVSPLARLIVTTFVNYEPVKMNSKLKDGDVISLMFPVAGG
jgi:molybdopterin converting factor small subunit